MEQNLKPLQNEKKPIIDTLGRIQPVRNTQLEKEKRNKYYPELEKFVTELGEWNASPTELGKQWNVPPQTIQRWKDDIRKKRGPIDIMKVGDNLAEAMKHNIQLCQKIKVTGNTKEKLQAISTLNQTAESFINILERMGYKQKVAEKIELNIENVKTYNFHIIHETKEQIPIKTVETTEKVVDAELIEDKE